MTPTPGGRRPSWTGDGRRARARLAGRAALLAAAISACGTPNTNTSNSPPTASPATTTTVEEDPVVPDWFTNRRTRLVFADVTPPTTTTTSPPAYSQEPLVRMPAIDLAEPLVKGGQAEIDDGKVVIPQWGHGIDPDGNPYPNGCLPEEDCTVWLAAHRTSRGSTFLNVPQLRPGDLIEIESAGQLFVYVVTRSAIVPGRAPVEAISGPLVIQTSWTGQRRWMVYAEPIT